MQYQAIWKDTFRELSHSIMRFLTILIIIFLGVGFYAGISGTSPNMLWTAEDYFSKQHLMDYRVVSTYGLTDEDVEALHQLSGYAVQSHYANDFVVADHSETMRLYSYNSKEVQSINDYYVTAGRLPETSGEVALDQQASFLSNVNIGDSIHLAEGDETGNPEEKLKKQTFQVVGFVNSPLFIELPARGNTTIGSGSLDGFGVILEEDYEAELKSEVYLTLEEAKRYPAYTADYEQLIEEKKKDLNSLLADLETRRTQNIKQEIQKEIGDGWAELKEVERELAAAKEELATVRSDLDQGLAEYEEGIVELEEQTTAAWQEISDSETRLQQELEQLATKEQELIQQRENLQAELNNLAGADTEIATGRTQLEQGITEAQGALSAVDSGLLEATASLAGINEKEQQLTSQKTQIEAALENPEADEAALQLQLGELEAGLATLQQEKDDVNRIVQELENQLNILSEQQNELESALAELTRKEQELSTGQAALTAGIRQVDQGLVQVEEARQQLHTGFAQIEAAKAALNTETEKSKAELATVKEELAEAEAEYQNGLAALEQEKQIADAEIENARLDLKKAEKNLADLPAPEYLLFDRSDNPGYLEYKDNADRLAIIAMVFPVFFFLIAIFISFTTMTRMVDEEREYIGIMKSLGYANHQILIKFITYAVLATSVGAAFGLLAGYTLIPKLIFFAYSSMYNFPKMLLRSYPLYTTIALTAAFVSTVGASLLAVRHSLKSKAAALLQPKAPKSGSRIWLERLPFIWKRLSFNQKITFRNVFRYKSRMLMTILGIAGSTGLILTGFGISDSISAIPEIQYGEINQFQAYVALKPHLTKDALEKYRESTAKDERIEDALLVTQKNATANKTELNEQKITLFVTNNPKKLPEFIKLVDYKEGTPYTLDDSGAVVTQKLAQLFEVEIGDALEILSSDQEKWTVEVTGIAENYIGHTLYMTSQYYQQLTGIKNEEPNLELLKYNPTAVDEAELGHDLISRTEVIGVNYVSKVAESFRGTLDSLDLITQILVVSAAALAFIVLYNLTNINVSERQRELSTIKVLGSYDYEVTMYIYRENIILTLLGILVGFGFGTVLTNFIMDTMEIDMLVFGREIHFSSYVYSSLLTLLFSLVVMVVIHYQLKQIDMVEALKAND